MCGHNMCQRFTINQGSVNQLPWENGQGQDFGKPNSRKIYRTTPPPGVPHGKQPRRGWGCRSWARNWDPPNRTGAWWCASSRQDCSAPGLQAGVHGSIFCKLVTGAPTNDAQNCNRRVIQVVGCSNAQWRDSLANGCNPHLDWQCSALELVSDVFYDCYASIHNRF